MPGPTRIAAAVLLFAALVLAAPRTARAEAGRTQTIHVLSIDSDDADEQADALTASLRAHVRQTPGWALLETTQSLSMLTAAFRCPQRPDPACLVRIGDKLQANQFLWGVMNKAPGHQVAVELHLWTRGKPDEMARESYADNVREASDDAVGRIATALLTKLIGAAGGFLVLHANADSGTVFVDGQQVGSLDHGRATIPLAPGPHSVEIVAHGYSKSKKDVTMASGASVQLDMQLDADGADGATTGPGKPFPTHAVVGWSAIAVGAVLGVVGVVETVSWYNHKSNLNNVQANDYSLGVAPTGPGTEVVPSKNGGTTTLVQDPCQVQPRYKFDTNLTTGCNEHQAATAASAAEVASFIVGGAFVVTGVIVLLTAPSAPKDSAAPATGLRSLHFLPSLGTRDGSMTVVGQF